MFILSPIAATWDPGAAEGDADRFLRTLADGDQEVFIVLCEIIGTCICSARISSQAAMLIGRADVSGGEASNGKSTFINVSRRPASRTRKLFEHRAQDHEGSFRSL